MSQRSAASPNEAIEGLAVRANVRNGKIPSISVTNGAHCYNNNVTLRSGKPEVLNGKSHPVSHLPVSPLAEPKRRHYSGSVRRPPSLLDGVKGLVLRPRSESFGARIERPKLLRKVQVASCTVDSVYDLREEEANDFYDDENAFRRPRSNSSDFLILRKTSRPLSVDVIGLVDAQSDPYRQYMKVVDCYEMAPNAGQVIVVDRTLKAGKVFTALCENGVGAALVWDSTTSKIVSIATFSDFLVYLTKPGEIASEHVALDEVLTTNTLVKVDADTKIFDACGEFLKNFVHRIVVCESNGDVLYLLTIKRVLQAIHKQNRSLHFAQWLNEPLRSSSLGLWGKEVHQVKTTDFLSVAVDLMLGFRLSSLPVMEVREDGHGLDAVDVLWKSDIAKALRGRKDAKEFFSLCTVREALLISARPAAPFLTEDETVSRALDVLLATRHMRCAFILNKKGALRATISFSDVLRHFIYNDDPFKCISPFPPRSESVSCQGVKTEPELTPTSGSFQSTRPALSSFSLRSHIHIK